MSTGSEKISQVLDNPSVRDFCKDIITRGFTKDCCDVVSDVELALKMLKIRRDDALGITWKKLKLKTGKHLKCGVSTTISGSFSFGNGECDENGFWENPCYECARNHEKRFTDDGACWPFRDV